MVAALVAATALLLGFVIATATASHGGDRHIDHYVGGDVVIGAPNTPGGFFIQSRDLAVYTGDDANSANDKVFTAESLSNSSRVQRIAANGVFELMWGKDTIAGNPATGYEVCVAPTVCKSGAQGTSAKGEFDDAVAVAVDQSDPTLGGAGSVYVYDRDNKRVQKFDLDGDFVLMFGNNVNQTAINATAPQAQRDVCTEASGNTCKIGVGGAAAGQIGPAGATSLFPALAVDPTTHSVYVADPSNRRVQQFSASGEFERLWGWDVSASDATNGFEVCAAADCKATGTAGTENGRFATNQPLKIAVDEQGIVYASDTNQGNRVMRFDSTEAAAPDLLEPPILSVTDGGPLIAGVTDGLAADDDHVFVLRIPSAAGAKVQVQEIDAAGASQLSISPPPGDAGQLPPTINFGGSQSRNVAVNRVSGDLYVSVLAGGGLNGYFVLDEDGFNPPTLEFGSPSEVTENTATVNATIDPLGGAADFRFEYSKSGANWAQTPPGRVIGAAQEVSAQLSGLEANTLYRVRLATSKRQGAEAIHTATSSESLFVTDAAPPVAETLGPVARTADSARLSGRLNPNGSLTTYRFQWGKTASYGKQVPVPVASAGMSGTPVFVVDQIVGLDPDTTYHYRLCAENAEGSACGADVSFKTRGVAGEGGVRGYEMITPPFKAARVVGSPLLRPGNNANPSVPSLDGETAHWSIHLFPLVDDALGALVGDRQIIRRTGQGWVGSTRNTRPFLSDPTDQTATEPGFLTKVNFGATSGDFETTTWMIRDGTITQDGLLPTQGKYANRFYTRRDGTGVGGFTPWLDNPEQQVVGQGFSAANYLEGNDYAVLNDDGSAMARFGWYRGLSGSDDPSVDQFAGSAGGTTPYLQRASDPAGMPSAPKEPINECTGAVSDGDATRIPARIGTGAATDTIGSQACEESDGTAVTGTGDLLSGSASVTNVTAGSGAFAVGQLIFGQGIPNGTRITAVGSGTLTLSAAAAPAASAFATVTEGSPTIQLEFSDPAPFAVGKPIAGAGIPPGTTLLSKSGNTFTLSQNATASGSFVTVTQGAPGPGTALEARAQHVASLRGATVGSNSEFAVARNSFRNSSNAGTVATALSDDGRRVFFQAPDFLASGVRTVDCAAQTGAGTDCVPQLFVRSHDSGGDPVVRWISRSRSVPTGSDNGYSGAMIAAQQVELMGAGVAFQGASRDGSVVYFKTNAPLTPDDPNATGTPGPKTTGSASASSWDLYRYELPADPDADPGDGVLTRVSGGPAGSADPSTNVSGGDAPLRFHSDDGSRAYFLTTSPIAGADNTPPAGGATSPGGAVGNTAVRNLYLFDDTKEGAERYRFIALLPYFSSGSSQYLGGMIDACASSGSRLSDQLAPYQEGAAPQPGNCFRGTADGRAVAFATSGRLTADDDDAAGDVYYYDADADELIRVSAPPAGAPPYICNIDTTSGGPDNEVGFVPTDPALVTARCNAELGRGTGVSAVRRGLGLAVPIGSWEASRGWGGMRYYNVARDGHGAVSIYFATSLPLVEEDRNTSFDVYQWRQGRRSLISPGDSADNAYFAGNSTDGEDVFFQTTQRIDPREVDAADLDVYNARVGGGFPYTPPPTPCDVLSFECESEASTGPAARGSATAGFDGSGNVRPAAARCGKNQARRGDRCVAKRKLAQQRCAKRKGSAKRRCVANQLRRLNRTANTDRRASR